MVKQESVPVEDKILQEPAEGDRATIDRELARKDGGNAAHDTQTGDGREKTHGAISTAMDEAAPQTGVRPGP